MNNLYYEMLETASNYHNSVMCGNKWDEDKQAKELKIIAQKILEHFGVYLETTVDILNDCEPAIEDYTDRYPDSWNRKEARYNRVIDELYNIIKLED